MPMNAATMGGRALLGGVAGAGNAALVPATSDRLSFVDEKAQQVGLGAAFGAAAPAVVGGVSRIISPKASVNPQVALLNREGVRPTVGQTLGGVANRIEEKLTSLPVIGDSIAHTRQRAVEQLDRAALNRALAPIGERLPNGVAGREAVEATEAAISRGYNRLLPSLTVQADQQFATSLGGLRNAVSTGAIDPRAAKSFERILQNDVLSKFGGQSAMTGQTFKQVESDLGAHIRRLGQSQDADQRLVGDALKQLQGELRQLLTRSNPDKSRELQALNTAWANFKRPQRAASMVGAEDGVFSPGQLHNAVKAADRSKDHGRFARGDALMQDLSEAGKTVLGPKVPDSGTAGRLFLGGLSLADPTLSAPLALAAGGLMYSPPVQGLLTRAITSRPQSAQAMAEALRQASPGFGLLGGQVGAQLVGQ